MSFVRLLAELTRVEAGALASSAVALFPVGATEQHGPHLPVGTDTFGIEEIARRAADRVGDRIPVVVTPTLPFGSSHHHLPFGGTMSLATETYYRTVFDLTESLVVSGFRRVMVLNGHGGNHELIQLVARDLALKHPVSVAAGSYWIIAREALIERGAQELGRTPGHAGAFETSLMMFLRPELVHEPRPTRSVDAGSGATGGDPTYRVETHDSWRRIDGFTDNPAAASAERGAAFLDAIVEAVSAAIAEFAARTARHDAAAG